MNVTAVDYKPEPGELAEGVRPPGLKEDGSFDTPLGIRAFSVVDAEGRCLSVDKTTGLLVPDPEDEEG
jgi:hypothetical protein